MITKADLTKQFRRLERFGKLNDLEFDDYFNLLKNYSLDKLSAAVLKITETYTGFGFPQVDDIKKAMSCVSKASSWTPGIPGSARITSAALGCYSVAYLLESKDMSDNYKQMIFRVVEWWGDDVNKINSCLEQLLEIKSQMLKLPQKKAKFLGDI